MPRPFIEDRATRAPSKCVVSGSGDGPIINTGMDYQDDRGRIYIAPRSIAHLLRDLGWTDPSDSKGLRSGYEQAQADLKQARAELEKLRALREAVDNLVEMPEPEIRMVEKVVQRDPTPQEVQDFIANNPDNPIVKDHQKPEKGSREEWFALYGKKGPLSKKQQAAAEAEKAREEMKLKKQAAQSGVDTHVDSEPVGEHDPKTPPQTVTLHGQEVDLDDLLSGTVKDVTAFIEGHPLEFQRAVADREAYLREQGGKEPRVTIIKAVMDAVEEEGNDE